MLRASDDDDDDGGDDDDDGDGDECRGPDLAQNADTHTHILCEPVQWKCMSTCHESHQKSHFMGKMKGKMPRPRRRHTHTHTLWGQACAVEIHVYMSQATSEEPLYTEIYRKNAGAHRLGPQNADTHFVRACAGQMHVKISQEPL